MQESSATGAGERRLLIVDDDAPLRNRLARAMEQRGFTTAIAASVAEGIDIGTENPPGYAAVDLYTCGDCDPMAAHRFLEEALGASRAHVRELTRGVQATAFPE